jgi:hypothetical protein
MKISMPAKLSAAMAALFLSAVSTEAATCVGSCGSSTIQDGIVTPAPGIAQYQWVSTADNSTAQDPNNAGVADGGIIASVGSADGGIADSNPGSTFTTNQFSALAGDIMEFSFNFVTTDGGAFTDYAWAELQDATNNAHVAWLFTARTSPTGNTSPGLGLPGNAANLTPSAVGVQAGTVWSALGLSSGDCFGDGCGNTGWISTAYKIANAGMYQLVLGVQNFNDDAFDSALAFTAIQIQDRILDPGTGNGGGEEIGDVPLPAAFLFLGTALVGIGGLSRRRKA